MLRQILADILKGDTARNAEPTRNSVASRPRVLNVGGGSKTIPIGAHYADWEHVLADVDPRGGPDIVCDARKLDSLEPAQFDAVYCSHNLEHYYAHDGSRVLHGFRHVLKDDGFAEIRVPDLISVMQRALDARLDLDDVLYQSAAGPIAVIDVIYGFRKEIEQSGKDYYAHKTGFSAASLEGTLRRAGFDPVYVFPSPAAFEVRALAFRTTPTSAQRQLLRLPG
ncbi:MAG TPA: methyltransferase domain-containing protein [Casimicrobiaceae bacterium]|nr:methyltransferase domain-containing protein [Casimicrobiaceae bacterium]